jgi:predicted Zn-dependent peptidase
MPSCRSFRIVCFLVLLPILYGVPAIAESAGNQGAVRLVESSDGGLSGRVVEHQYSNGLQLLVVERHEVPIVSCTIVYKVGGVNEHTGITGVAHLYEHMAFKGTRTLGTKDYRKESGVLKQLDRTWYQLRVEENKGSQGNHEKRVALEKRFQELEQQSEAFVIPNEVAEIYERNGAVGLNATTGKDVTRYVVSLPSNRLELWATIESDRMSHPVLREFYKEKKVVLEERRLRSEDSPTGRLYEAFLATAFIAHPYRLPVIGWKSDLDALSRAETENFFRVHYSPENAVIAIVGDVDAKATIGLVDRYFGHIPPQPSPPSVVTVEPDQDGERRVEVEFDAEPVFVIGYHRPGLDHPDHPVFDVIDSLLSGGRSSRLFTSLAKQKKLVLNVSTSAGVPGALYPNLFMIQATPRTPHTTQEVETAIYAELERLKTEPVDPRELQKVLNNLDAFLIRSLDSNSGLSSGLSYFKAVTGSWRYLLDNRERIAHVTSEDVSRVARQYFTENNRTVATLVKKKEEEKK